MQKYKILFKNNVSYFTESAIFHAKSIHTKPLFEYYNIFSIEFRQIIISFLSFLSIIVFIIYSKTF